MKEPRIEYNADILLDGEIIGSIFSYSMEGLEGQLYKLERIGKQFEEGDYDE